MFLKINQNAELHKLSNAWGFCGSYIWFTHTLFRSHCICPLFRIHFSLFSVNMEMINFFVPFSIIRETLKWSRAHLSTLDVTGFWKVLENIVINFRRNMPYTIWNYNISLRLVQWCNLRTPLRCIYQLYDYVEWYLVFEQAWLSTLDPRRICTNHAHRKRKAGYKMWFCYQISVF